MVTLANWRERMSEDMRLRDFRPRTQEGYLLAVRLFVERLAREPEALTDDDVRRYFLYLREDKKLAPSTINSAGASRANLALAVCALRFFFVHTMQRDRRVFDLLRVNMPRRLPVVLSPAEVRTLLKAVRHPVRRMALTTIYALGLRLGEGLSLEAEHIDGQRLMVWVRDGKGAKDRGTPLPRPLLGRLRRYWKTERPDSPTKYLFVSTNGLTPLHETTLQKTFTAALRETRIDKHATIHTLRHYAEDLMASTAQDVTFRYRDSRDGVRKTMTLPSDEFLRRFLRHVPPRGFHRVRAFGLLHPQHRDTLRRLQLLLTPKSPLPQSVAAEKPSSAATKSRLKCPHCASPSLRLMHRLSALECMTRNDARGEQVPGIARAPPSPPLEVAGAV